MRHGSPWSVRKCEILQVTVPVGKMIRTKRLLFPTIPLFDIQSGKLLRSIRCQSLIEPQRIQYRPYRVEAFAKTKVFRLPSGSVHALSLRTRAAFETAVVEQTESDFPVTDSKESIECHYESET
jgi:hypothetical protein